MSASAIRPEVPGRRETDLGRSPTRCRAGVFLGGWKPTGAGSSARGEATARLYLGRRLYHHNREALRIGAEGWRQVSKLRRAVSSAGRAPALQAGGRLFEPGTAH
jgi:hypothetical protein